MGVIERAMDLAFGHRGIERTIGMFREGAEGAATRAAGAKSDAMAQYAAEFARQRKGLFDRGVDALNRLPRPLMAFGALGLVTSAMVDPVWFAARMQGVALVPDPLWWLMGAVVSFYFGARHQAKGQEFDRDVATAVARTRAVAEGVRQIEGMRAAPAARAEPPVTSAPGPEAFPDNAALRDWARSGGRVEP
ncbi:MAG: holin family protein [Paracoccaceae bacterium]